MEKVGTQAGGLDVEDELVATDAVDRLMAVGESVVVEGMVLVMDTVLNDVALIDVDMRTEVTDSVDAEVDCDAGAEDPSVDVLAGPKEMDATLLNRPVHTWSIATPSLTVLFM